MGNACVPMRREGGGAPPPWAALAKAAHSQPAALGVHFGLQCAVDAPRSDEEHADRSTSEGGSLSSMTASYAHGSRESTSFHPTLDMIDGGWGGGGCPMMRGVEGGRAPAAAPFSATQELLRATTVTMRGGGRTLPLAALIDLLPTAVLGTDLQGHIQVANKLAEQLFGHDQGELLGMSVELLMPPALRGAHKLLREAFQADPTARAMGGRGKPLMGQRKDGSTFHMEAGLSPLPPESGGLTLAAVVDISGRVREEERLRMVVEAAPSGMVLVDEGGLIVLVNRAAETMFGYGRADLLGKPIELLVHPRCRVAHEVWRRGYTRCPSARAMGAGRDLHGLRSDGSEFPVEIGLQPIPMHTSATSLSPRSGVTGSTSHGDGGSSMWVLAAVLDISERKRAEELTRAVDVAQRAIKSRGEILTHMSHELRTPLHGVIGTASLLAEALTENRAMLHTITTCADITLAVINDILDFSKIDAGRLDIETVMFSTRDLISGVASLFSSAAVKKGITLRTELHDSVPGKLCGDSIRIRQILVNLTSNALKFTPRGGTVSVRLSGELCAHDPSAHLPTALLPLGFLLRGAVTDTGVGVSEEAQRSLFQPFVQGDASITRRFGGTGLGLAICKRLALLMEGDVGVQSSSPSGSVFAFSVHTYCVPEVPEAEGPAGGHVVYGQGASAALDEAARQSLEARISGDLLLACKSPTHVPVDVGAAAKLEAETVSSSGNDAEDAAALHVQRQRVEGDTARCPARVQGWTAAAQTTGGASAESSAPPSPGPRASTEGVGGRETSHAPPPLASTPTATAGPPPMNLTVLIADDNMTNIRLAKAFVTKLGCTPILAVNGLQAAQAWWRVTQPGVSLEDALRVVGAEWLLPLAGGEGEASVQSACHGSTLHVPAEEQRDEASAARGGVSRGFIPPPLIIPPPRSRIDAVILDCEMPIMSGFDAARCIRAMEAAEGRGRHTAIIAVTASAMTGDMERCLAAGMDGYLAKPVRFGQLKEALDRNMLLYPSSTPGGRSARV